MDNDAEFTQQLGQVRPTTRNLVEAVMRDAWPSDAAEIDFGIDSQKHYEALYFPIREGKILPKALDEALGHGEKLTGLVRDAASNPHKDVEFHTSWDLILCRDSSRSAEKIGLKELRKDNAKAHTSEREVIHENDRGDMER